MLGQSTYVEADRQIKSRLEEMGSILDESVAPPIISTKEDAAVYWNTCLHRVQQLRPDITVDSSPSTSPWCTSKANFTTTF